MEEKAENSLRQFEGLQWAIGFLDPYPIDLNELETMIFNGDIHVAIAKILDPTFEENREEYQRLINEIPPSKDMDGVVGDIALTKMRAMMLIGIIHGLRLAGLSAEEVEEKMGKLHW